MVWPDTDDNTDAMFHGWPFGFGWKPQLPDHRDLQFSSIIPSALALPPKASLRSQINWQYNQGRCEGCTGFSTATAVRLAIRKSQNNLDIDPSCLFLYYNARKLENDTYRDAGAYIRDVFQGIGIWGVAAASDWPFSTNKVLTSPPQNAYNDAKKEILTGYYAVNQDPTDLKSCIALGHPFVAGITVFKSLIQDNHGHVSMPHPNDKPMGGHAICFTGYDDTTQEYEFKNSWGEWGDNGYGYLPYQFVESENYTSDFWTVVGK